MSYQFHRGKPTFCKRNELINYILHFTQQYKQLFSVTVISNDTWLNIYKLEKWDIWITVFVVLSTVVSIRTAVFPLLQLTTSF